MIKKSLITVIKDFLYLLKFYHLLKIKSIIYELKLVEISKFDYSKRHESI